MQFAFAAKALRRAWSAVATATQLQKSGRHRLQKAVVTASNEMLNAASAVVTASVVTASKKRLSQLAH